MSVLLTQQERIRNSIELGESHFREFKSAYEGEPGKKKPRPVRKICEDIAEALVAFSNADGGELLVGVEDEGRVTGVPHTKEDIERMLNAHKTHVYPGNILPIIARTEIAIDNLPVLFFAVNKGTTEIYQLADGSCVRRTDASSPPVTIAKILFDRQESRSRAFDQSFVDGATVNDLDVELMQYHANDYLRGLSVERYLQQIGVAEYTSTGIRLRMAALLLYAKSIHKWLVRSQIRILHVTGTELKSGDNYNVRSDEFVQGHVFFLLEEGWKKIRPFLADKTNFGPDAKFEQKYIYPEHACQEALVNRLYRE